MYIYAIFTIEIGVVDITFTIEACIHRSEVCTVVFYNMLN